MSEKINVGGREFTGKQAERAFSDFTKPKPSLLDEAVEGCIDGIQTRCPVTTENQAFDYNVARSRCIDIVNEHLKYFRMMTYAEALFKIDHFSFSLLHGPRPALRRLGNEVGSSENFTGGCDQFLVRHEAVEPVTEVTPRWDPSERNLLVVAGGVAIVGGIALLLLLAPPAGLVALKGAVAAGAVLYISDEN